MFRRILVRWLPYLTDLCRCDDGTSTHTALGHAHYRGDAQITFAGCALCDCPGFLPKFRWRHGRLTRH